MMQNLWMPESQRLLERLKLYIVSVPMLAIPDTYRRFYIKTYWSKVILDEVITQSYGSVEARKEEVQEKSGVKC